MSKDIEQLVASLGKELKEQNALFREALDHQKHDTPAATQTANQLHGINGLFSNTTERDVVSAHIRPAGIANVLGLQGSVDEDPTYSTITGFTDTTSGPQTTLTDECNEASKAHMKGCDQTARFGLFRVDTNEIKINNVMRRLHRGDFRDLRLAGQVLGLTNLEPRGLMGKQDQILSIITAAEMVIAGVSAERQLNTQIWQGVFGTTDKYGTQFAGLDSMIATGYVDKTTNVACPAMDSDVKDFAYDDVEGTDRSIVTYLTMLEYYVYFNAERSGLLPVSWVWVMRPELWQVLTEIWPCQYNTNRCANSVISTQSEVIIDGRENMRDRDAMRNGMTLEVNGRSYPVILDDGIHEATNITDANLAAGEYASSIYLVPLRVQGALPATWREHLDYNDGFVTANLNLLRNMPTFWTDDGIYEWAYNQTRFCYDLSLKTEQRVLLRTPQLAGKIQNIKYVPLQHLRSSDPESPYFADGGISLRASTGTWYAVWN